MSGGHDSVLLCAGELSGRIVQTTSLPVWGMVLTPFNADGSEIDQRSLRRHVRSLSQRGCTGLIALGTIAEPAALSLQEKILIVSTLLAENPSLPVVIGLMAEDESQRNTESARFISEFGAAATGFMVPVTSDKPSELRRSLIALYERTGANLYLQDYPAPTGIHITVEDLLRAVDGLPFIAAIKCESAPTFWRISELSRYQRDIVMMSGLGGIGLIDDLMCGASAVACGISRPEHIVAATTAWLAGRRSEAAHQVNSIAGLISFETQAQTSIGIRKEHWRRQGVIEHSTVRRPTLPYPSNLDACSSLHGFVDRPRIHPL